LSKLIAARMKLEAQGGRLVLCNLGPQLREVFAVTRLDGLFHFRTDEAASTHTEQSQDPPAEPATQPESCRAAMLLCDPDHVRGERLTTALRRGGLAFARSQDLEEVARCCREGTVAAVAMPLEWPPRSGVLSRGVSAALLDFIRAHGQQTAVVVYA